MGCERSFVTIKLIWYSYVVSNLNYYAIKLLPSF
jgi:hypothetical protein